MVMEIKWTEEAYQSYDDIIDFLIKEWDKQTIQKFVLDVEEKEDMIFKNPYIGIEFLEKYRKIVVGKLNLLVYKIDEDNSKLIILYIWDGRKDPEELKYLLSY